MKLIEDLLEYFDGDIDSSGDDLSFLDDGSATDLESLQRIERHYGLSLGDSEEFLEITQSIQHSLGDLADQETLANIDDYIDSFNAEPNRVTGLINNVKGIYGEHQVIENLQESFTNGEKVLRTYATNTPDVDLEVFDADGNLMEKIQVKVSNDPHYILQTRAELASDITILTTEEVIEEIISLKGELPDGIISSGLSCTEITDNVARTINILSQTEPEFNMMITDPVISEHLQQGSNPFAEAQVFGRQVHADKRYNIPIRWVYSSGEISDEVLAGTEAFSMNWSPENFSGLGDPLREAGFFSPQSTEFSCAIATQRNIIESLTGELLSEAELCEYAADKGIFDPKSGTLSENLSALLKEKGLDCQDLVHAEFSMIEEALQNGKRVMVGVDASEISNPLRALVDSSVVEQQDMLHCLQVTGIDYSDPIMTKVILSDSSSSEGALTAVSLEDFMSAWEDAQRRLTIIGKKA